jgi:hypothetical protein
MRLRSVIYLALEYLARRPKGMHSSRWTNIEDDPIVASADYRRRRQRGGVVGRRSTSGGFFSGLILGLGAASLVNSAQTETPRYPGKGLRGDWFAVGDDLKSAMRRVNGEEA